MASESRERGKDKKNKNKNKKNMGETGRKKITDWSEGKIQFVLVLFLVLLLFRWGSVYCFSGVNFGARVQVGIMEGGR